MMMDEDDIPKRIDGAPWRLNRRAERVIDYMIEGDPLEQPREPLDFYAACKAAGYVSSRKAARFLSQQDAFNAALAEKRRLYARDGYLTCQTPSYEHVRDLVRWQEERKRLHDENKRLRCLKDPISQPRRDPGIRINLDGETW